MLDSDIDFCDKQIEIQREKLSALNSARHQANREHAEAQQVVAAGKKEVARIGHMVNELNKRWGEEKTILKKMCEHRADLKMLKRMAENQHNMVQGGENE